MPNIGPTELIIVLAIALLVLGPKRLPEAGRAVGKGMREFKESAHGSLARRPRGACRERIRRAYRGEDEASGFRRAYRGEDEASGLMPSSTGEVRSREACRRFLYTQYGQSAR
jgi:sec-independent protein translocase protein TatA